MLNLVDVSGLKEKKNIPLVHIASSFFLWTASIGHVLNLQLVIHGVTIVFYIAMSITCLFLLPVFYCATNTIVAMFYFICHIDAT